MYPLCFDFSQCPLTQPFHIFVNNHHFRNLFNLKYPATVDSFVTTSSLLLTRSQLYTALGKEEEMWVSPSLIL